MISRATNPASTKWKTNAVLRSLQLNRETPCVANMDTGSTSDLEKLTDNNTFLHLPSHQLNRLSEPIAVSIPNSRFPEQQNFFSPVSDIKSNENQLQKFILPLKLKPESSYQKKNYMQSEFSCYVNEEHMNKNTQTGKINVQKMNDKHMKYISNVPQIDGPKINSFEDLLKTQNTYVPTHETSTSLPLQSTVVHKPLGDCHTGMGTEISTDEEPPVLSCDMFDTFGNNILDGAAFDKLQNSDHEAGATDTAFGKVVTQNANYFVGFGNTSSIMEGYFHKADSELCEKCSNQNNCSRRQPFVTVTDRDKHLKECVSSQDVSHNKEVGTENLEMAIHEDESHKMIKEDTEMSVNWLVHETQFQSSKVTTLQKKQVSVKSHEASEIQGLRLESSIQLKTRASSKVLATKTPNQSHYKEEVLPTVGEQSHKTSCVKEKKHEDKFLKGRSYTPIRRKLKVQGMFQKRRKTQSTLCSNQQTTSSAVTISSSKTETSSAVGIKDGTVDTLASCSRNNRKTTFQIPFKKIPAQAKQVHKYIFSF